MISVRNLFFSYPGNDQDTLREINLDIQEGEIFGFLGPSGAGKSTTQKILIGLLGNYRGQVQVNNQSPSDSQSTFYESIGVAFETPNLYSKFTALENLAFFCQFYASPTREPEELLEAVGLIDAANTRVSEFSKGMKVRLNFCRSLINKPKLIFLDEPTSGLDPVNLRGVLAMIKAEQALGSTICLTTHDMHVADTLCDRVAFIVDGEISLIDAPRQLKLLHGERVIDIEYRQNDVLTHMRFPMDNIAQNNDFQSILQQNIIETIHSQEASLEDVFIKTTGRGLS